MNYFSNWFNNENEDKPQPDTYTPCMLDQGKLWNNRQYKREESLQSNIDTIEGFSTNNNSQLSETMTLSDDFDRKIDRYTTQQPILIDETRNFMKLNDRNKNIKMNEKLYDITYEKEGCYKENANNNTGLLYQEDMKDVSVQTCKMRASDLAYAGFAVKKNTAGQMGCYLTNDIEGAKAGGLATKSMTSFSFKKSNLANIGGLLPNGQVGIYNNKPDNNLLTDLTAREGCDIKGGKVLINDKTLVASYGLNCNKK
jgi:hypothetical protein